MQNLQREIYKKDIEKAEERRDLGKALFSNLADYVSVISHTHFPNAKGSMRIGDICFIDRGRLKVRNYSVNGDGYYRVLVQFEYLSGSTEGSLQIVRREIQKMGLGRIEGPLVKVYIAEFEDFQPLNRLMSS